MAQPSPARLPYVGPIDNRCVRLEAALRRIITVTTTYHESDKIADGSLCFHITLAVLCHTVIILRSAASSRAHLRVFPAWRIMRQPPLPNFVPPLVVTTQAVQASLNSMFAKIQIFMLTLYFFTQNHNFYSISTYLRDLMSINLNYVITSI